MACARVIGDLGGKFPGPEETGHSDQTFASLLRSNEGSGGYHGFSGGVGLICRMEGDVIAVRYLDFSSTQPC